MSMKECIGEFLGIMVGDGNIYVNPAKRTYRFVVTGHSENDYDYLTNHVSSLIENLFKRKPSVWKHKNKRAIALSICSRDIIESLVSLGLIWGRKSRIVEIPGLILHSKDSKLKAAFIRGLADTDFSIHFHKGTSRKNFTYPVITGTTASKTLAEQIKKILEEFGIKANLHIDKRYSEYQLDIYGKQNLENWMKLIGFNNPNHATKIKVWEKLGFNLPNTSLKERLLILNNQ